MIDIVLGWGQSLAGPKCGDCSAPPVLSSAMAAGGTRASCLLLGLGLHQCFVHVCLLVCSAAQTSAASWSSLTPGRTQLAGLT